MQLFPSITDYSIYLHSQTLQEDESEFVCVRVTVGSLALA